MVLCGHRHWNIIRLAWDDLKLTDYIRQDMQGFLTSKGRYVTREEGVELQLAAGIPSVRGHYGPKLYSEDLY